MLSDIGPPQHVWLIVGDSRAMLPCEGLLAKPRWNGVFPWPRPIARGEDFVSKIVFPARNVRFVHVSFSDIEKYNVNFIKEWETNFGPDYTPEYEY